MRKKLTVAVIHNEPVTAVKTERRFVSEQGILGGWGKGGNGSASPLPEVLTDLSEVGVLEEREDVARALQANGYRAKVFNLDGNIARLIDFLEEEKPDVIFNLCESVGNLSVHEMHVAGIYELMKIPFTGSDALTLGTALGKVRTKELLMLNGLPTPRFQLFKSPGKVALDESMSFPLIVKPSREDASIGIEPASIVTNAAELRRRIRHIIELFDQPALVEEFIDGRELNVGILGNRKPIVFPISEIDMSTLPKEYPRIITYNAKWMKGTDEYEHTRGVCPALLPPQLETEIKDMALQAYRILGCRDYARVDFRLSKDHQPFILEVNPNPDISDEAGFARSARAHGLTFDDLVARIVECALERVL